MSLLTIAKRPSGLSTTPCAFMPTTTLVPAGSVFSHVRWSSAQLVRTSTSQPGRRQSRSASIRAAVSAPPMTSVP